jgi:hypothetical protein
VIPLINFGSIHNFIAFKLVSSVGLKAKAQPITKFLSRSSQRHYDGVRRDGKLKLQLDGYDVTSDFYVLALAKAAVSMGAQWLKTLAEFRMNLYMVYIKFEEGVRTAAVHSLRAAA